MCLLCVFLGARGINGHNHDPASFEANLFEGSLAIRIAFPQFYSQPTSSLARDLIWAGGRGGIQRTRWKDSFSGTHGPV